MCVCGGVCVHVWGHPLKSSGAEVVRVCKLPDVGAEDWTRETEAAKLLDNEPSLWPPVHPFVIHQLHCCVL